MAVLYCTTPLPQSQSAMQRQHLFQCPHDFTNSQGNDSAQILFVQIRNMGSHYLTGGYVSGGTVNSSTFHHSPSFLMNDLNFSQH
jgi:hypothetical protein